MTRPKHRWPLHLRIFNAETRRDREDLPASGAGVGEYLDQFQ